MPTGTIRLNATIGGFDVPSTVAVDQEIQTNFEESLPAAKTGTLTTRTDDNTGTITGQSAHGITTGMIFDAYWENADGTVGCQYNIVAGTVSGTSIPFDSGVGDNMPVADTALTITPRTLITGVSIVGNSLSAMLAMCKGKYCIRLQNSTTVHAAHIAEASEPYFWWDTCPYTNPIAGDTIDTIVVSNGESAAAKDFKIVVALTS